MNAAHRAYLEAIATSSDRSVKPTDRIRAIELLREAGGDRDCPRCAELASYSDDQLEQELRDYTRDAEAEIERRAEARVRELADTDRIEAEIERRAEERARELYASRAFALVQDGAQASSPPKDGEEAAPEGNAPQEAGESRRRYPSENDFDLPAKMKPGWQLERGWPDHG